MCQDSRKDRPKGAGDEWLTISLLASCVVSVTVVVGVLVLVGKGLYLVPLAALSFGVSFGVLLYFNPVLWHKRMALSLVAAIIAASISQGVEIDVPLGGDAGTFRVVVSPPTWPVYLALVVLIIFFTMMHSKREKLNPEPDRL